jgi:putative ABC transport system permease protein
VRRDLLYALRALRRAPGFTAVAVATLALGIGANTAIFSLVHAVILKPLPYRDPARLIAVWDTYLPQFSKVGVSPAELEAWQRQPGLFAESAWYRYVPFDLTLAVPGSEATSIHAAIVSPRLGPLLGVAPAIGHGFASNEPPNSVLLSQSLWRTDFSGDRAVTGKTIRLDGQEYTVAGVMPREGAFPDWAEVWLPPSPLQRDELTNPVRHALGFVARLAPGVTQARAAASLEGIERRLAAERTKTSTGWGMRVMGLQADLTASTRPALLLLWGAVSLVLLIACANVANLLLSRASGRAREMALRTALGASAWRLGRQLVTESLLLAAAGGCLGWWLAVWTLTAVTPERSTPDGSVLLFLVAITAATGAIAGLAPAAQALRSNLNSIIKAGSFPGGGSARVRGGLVVAEVALAMMVATGAGILARSFLRLMNVDPGFQPHGLLTLRVSLPPSRGAAEWFHRVDQGLRALPGVESLAVANVLPLAADRANTSRFSVPGSPLIDPAALPAAQLRAVSSDYFAAMRIPLRSGRSFTERDLTGDAVIINETMARRFWPGRDPVGLKFITGPWGANPTYGTIAGVVGDVKQFGLDSEPTFDIYSATLAPRYLIVRTAGDPAALASAVRREIHAADAAAPITEVRTMDEVLAESARSRRWTMALLVAFAALALVLSVVGIYGVMAWSAGQRTREIGIRMALGAGRGTVLGMVIRQGLRLCAVGLLLGLGGAWVFRRVLASLVFEVGTFDPAAYAAAAGLMVAAALLACYIPARRASRVDPVVALRWE